MSFPNASPATPAAFDPSPSFAAELKQDPIPSARTTANRENAQLSTGPRTDAGKRTVRWNALKHGIYSKSVLLPGEDPAEFAELEKVLRDRFNPGAEYGNKLLELLIAAEWRYRRLLSMSDQILAFATNEELAAQEERFEFDDPETRFGAAQAAAYRKEATKLNQLHRHQRALEAQIAEYRKILLSFEEGNRRMRENAARQEQLQRQREAAGQQQRPNGFVPASAPEPPKFTGPLKEFKQKQWLKQQQKSGQSS
jgi:hypothetical protein